MAARNGVSAAQRLQMGFFGGTVVKNPGLFGCCAGIKLAGPLHHMLTLARLAGLKAPAPAAKAAEKLISTTLAAFKLAQRDHDAIFGPEHWKTLRRKLADAIETLRK